MPPSEATCSTRPKRTAGCWERRGCSSRTSAASWSPAPTTQPSSTSTSRGALIANALSGEPANGAWLDEERRRLFMAVAVPLRASPTESPRGALVAAYAIDDALAEQIKQATTTDVVFFALDTLHRAYIVGTT